MGQGMEMEKVMELWEEYLKLDADMHMLHMQSRFKMIGQNQIHPGQMALLMAVVRLGHCNQRTLATAMRCSPASIAVSMKRMEKSGLIKKEPDLQDMRSTKIVLTDKGREFAERATSCGETLSKICLRGFSERETTELIFLNARIRDNMEDYLKEIEKKGE